MVKKLLLNKVLLNALLFQIGWFAAVLGGNWGALIALCFIGFIHHSFIMSDKREWFLIAAVGFTGLIVDNLLTALGIFAFETASMVLIPVWLLVLWLLFAMTLNHSLSWLKNRLLLAALLGGISGPTSYLAGSKLTSVVLQEPVVTTLLIIGVCWAMLLPLMFLLLRRVLR